MGIRDSFPEDIEVYEPCSLVPFQYHNSGLPEKKSQEEDEDGHVCVRVCRTVCFLPVT